jgi:hypothetical protein
MLKRVHRGLAADRVCVTTLVLATVVACSAGVARTGVGPVDLAAEALPAFVFGEFGGVSRATLETSALPYKVVATALIIREERTRTTRLGRADIPSVYRQFGFLYPARIANWPPNVPAPRFERPIGTVGHTLVGPTALVRVDAVNIGCATCHSGPLYGSDGRATDSVWVGSPNTSINLEAYTQAVYQGLKLAMADPTGFRHRIVALFPETGSRERFTLHRFLLPRIAKRLREFAAAGDAPLPFSNGAPGITNGVAALKRMLGVPRHDPGLAEVGFTSIPDLSTRALRSSLLSDGVYAPIGADRFAPRDRAHIGPSHLDSLAQIVAFFTVSTMGVTADVGEKAIPAIRPVVAWLATGYTSPPFPGPIDTARMRAGEVLFSTRCASCHGTYAEGRPRSLESFPNRFVAQESIGTDSMRWQMVDSLLLIKLRNNAYARHMTSARTGGYVAPILSGLWATAPYLHNGSVPTIWQLMTPSERPAEFELGGHALDYDKLGIAARPDEDGVYRYPSGYTPWSTPELYDTRKPGMSNRGHERQFAGLTEDEKRALIEYLKTL